MNIQALIQTLRPSFLVITPVCVLLGTALAYNTHGHVELSITALVLLGALMAHISVNTLNEYDDFRSGLDLNTVKTPFSGGSGALPSSPETAPQTLFIGVASLLITVAIGIYFIQVSDWAILPIGLAGIVVVITYTRWINRHPLLCLLAPGFATGPLMIGGTYLMLTGSYSPLLWQLTLVPFFLNNNLLLLNQYPDIQADQSIGRKTFPITFGITFSNLVYGLFMTASYAIILALVMFQAIPSLSLIALLPAFFSLLALKSALDFSPAADIAPQHLWANVVAAILTPLLLAIGLLLG
ncbi:MAG: prenyltransferase [Zetaproteobacteria bacterium CG2_30_46_52]|nr:MAG: prenyltransferase [Zetaproteobacteria bacterium CG2_30_46_52]